MTDPIAEGVKLVPGLQEDVDEMKRSPLWPQSVPLHRNTLEAIIRALTAAGEMERELAEAREALKPFASSFDIEVHLSPDDESMTVHCRVSDLRRAARAYSGTSR